MAAGERIVDEKAIKEWLANIDDGVMNDSLFKAGSGDGTPLGIVNNELMKSTEPKALGGKLLLDSQ